MKPNHTTILLLGLVLSFTAFESAQAQSDVTADNVTIQQSMNMGLIYSTGIGANAAQMAGMRVVVTQGQSEVPVWYDSVTPGYWLNQNVTVEDYGNIDEGYWADTTQYQQVGEDSYPAIYNEEGVEIQAAYTVPRYDFVVTGNYWVSTGGHWGVTGTHEEYQNVWQDEVHNPFSVMEASYGAPRIEFQATRSDANWVWRLPDGGGDFRDVLTLWDGGLSLLNANANMNMALVSDALTYSKGQAAPNGQWQSTYNRMDADENKMETTQSGSVNNQWQSSTSRNRVQSNALILERFETVNSVSTSAQTQIAAKSASFGGVVEVAGDLKVRGVLRVQPAGNLTMGAYITGPQP